MEGLNLWGYVLGVVSLVIVKNFHLSKTVLFQTNVKQKYKQNCLIYLIPFRSVKDKDPNKWIALIEAKMKTSEKNA